MQLVSRDAAQDDRLGLIFPAGVKLQNAALMIDGVRVQLTPGMSLSVEIKTGKRRVIDYLLSPLQTHAKEAMRERLMEFLDRNSSEGRFISRAKMIKYWSCSGYNPPYVGR